MKDMHQKGVEVIVFTDVKEIANNFPSILIDTDGDDLNALIMNLVLSQILSFKCSIARGYNPDAPIGVTKNTVTY